MSLGRIVAAGLMAGLVLNAGEAALHGAVYAEASEAAMKALGREIAGAGADTARLVLITFLQGLLGMALYSAVTARWGTGVGTAIRVGLIVWVLSGVYSAVYLSSGFAGVFPAELVWGPALWELGLYPAAMVVGSLLLKAKQP